MCYWIHWIIQKLHNQGAATSLHYVNYSKALEGVTDLVLAESVCVCARAVIVGAR